MSKQVAYSMFSGQILQWQDAELLHYPEPPDNVAVATVNEAEWNQQETLKWVVDGALTDIEPALEIPELTEEQAGLISLAKRDALLTQATAAIAPLQDAVDLDEATNEEVAALTAWKRYRVTLSRIEEQPGFPMDIDWPVIPQRANTSSPRH